MRSFLTIVVLAAVVAVAASAGAQDIGRATEGAPLRDVYTAWGHDFQLFMGTEGPVNSSTGSRTCTAGPCGWAAGVHVPSGAELATVALSACDGDPTAEVSFTLLRGPNVPGTSVLLLPFVHSGVSSMPGCTTFEGALTVPEIVENKDSAYVFVVNSTPGANVEWNQVRVTYRIQ